MTSIFQNNLRRIFRSSMRVAILLVLPLLFMNIFVPASYDVPIRVVFIDEDGTALTRLLNDKLSAQFELVQLTESGILPALLDDRVQYAIIAREGFTKQLLDGDTPALEAHKLEGPNTSLLVQGYVNTLMNSIAPIAQAAGSDEAAMAAGLESFARSGVGADLVPTEEANKARTIAVLGFLVQFMLYMSVVTTGLILEERSNRSLYRIFAAPITAKQYMGGHLMSSLVVGLLQVSTVFLALRYWMNVQFGAAFMGMFVLFSIFAVVCVCMGLLITAYCQNPKQAYLGVMFLATPLVMLGGCYWPRSFMPDMLVRISNLLPTTWIMEGARKLLEGGSLWSIGGEITVLFAFAAVFFAAGVLRKVDVAN